MGRQNKDIHKSYMKVTNDRYELPLSPPMTLDEIAALTGMNRETLRWNCTPSAMRKVQRAKKHYKPWKVIAFFEEAE